MKRILNIVVLGLVLVLALSFIPQSQAQSGYTWTADFYNNTSLSGTAIRQTYNNVTFNWGTGSPISGIGADNWSVRFNTVANFNAGTYRFTINADDAVRLYVHGQLYIDTWNAPQVGQNLTADINLNAGAAGVVIDFRENTGNAYINVSWTQISGSSNPIPTGSWVAEYWNNRNLSNNPNVVQNEASPSHDWGTGAPVNGVGADNFSARFSSQQQFNAGTYRITITVDDGVRVSVNGSRVIDEWHGSPTIATYTRDVTLFTGLNTFVIEYYEDTGVARLSYSITSLSQPSQPPVTSVAMVTINTPLLNVRSAPFIGDNIINKVPRGATYIVVGRNADSSWWQIQIGAQVGWVSGAYVIPANTQNVPVVTASVPNTPVQGTGYFLRATANLNIRTGAGTSFSRINILPLNAQAEIVGRNSSNTWWMVSYGGTTGWVSGAFVTLPTGIDLNRVPVR